MKDLLKDTLRTQTDAARKSQYESAEAEALRIIAMLPDKMQKVAEDGQDQMAIQSPPNQGVAERVMNWLSTEGLCYRAEHGRLLITWK